MCGPPDPRYRGCAIAAFAVFAALVVGGDVPAATFRAVGTLRSITSHARTWGATARACRGWRSGCWLREMTESRRHLISPEPRFVRSCAEPNRKSIVDSRLTPLMWIWREPAGRLTLRRRRRAPAMRCTLSRSRAGAATRSLRACLRHMTPCRLPEGPAGRPVGRLHIW